MSACRNRANGGAAVACCGSGAISACRNRAKGASVIAGRRGFAGVTGLSIGISNASVKQVVDRRGRRKGGAGGALGLVGGGWVRSGGASLRLTGG